ncbi:MAG: hypothetical protein FWF98_02270 [Dehalococcoidia bacterium]|nr:hypothetical protein [Dehalococcoidia bacterium]
MAIYDCTTSASDNYTAYASDNYTAFTPDNYTAFTPDNYAVLKGKMQAAKRREVLPFYELFKL